LVLELCVQAGIEVAETDLEMGSLGEAREAFLTSTTREVQSIGSVDGRELAEAPGETTAVLRAAFRELVLRDLDP
ncbi:MAG: 4-amino-4-deoxychorismate lyase, partial [Verrucomicrobiales bacterium]